jgi:2'-5' RNA ligase
MDSCCGAGRINSFALVGYLPEPLAGFVNGVRREIKPEYNARAHITVLPPRPLACAPEAAWSQVQDRLRGFGPFLVELLGARVFPVSDVIYLALGAGYEDLERLHGRLNQGCLVFAEPWCYHPHVTLAQDLEWPRVAPGLELAKRRWREFQGPRNFSLDHLTFVQETEGHDWVDLECCDLRPALVG